jgi:hypothetical protein
MLKPSRLFYMFDEVELTYVVTMTKVRSKKGVIIIKRARKQTRQIKGILFVIIRDVLPIFQIIRYFKFFRNIILLYI